MPERHSRTANFLLTLFFAILGFVVMGYHPGLEDDGVYLAAIKSNLNPALFPYDANFFRLQLQATLFDKWVAALVRLAHIPVEWVVLLLQFGAIFLVVYGAFCTTRTLFEERLAQWAGVALLTAMLTLPVAGTAVSIMDQHLHPRNLALALILFAVSRILTDRKWQAVPLLLIAFVVHPIMGAMGMSFSFFLVVSASVRVRRWMQRRQGIMASLVPLGWMFEPASPSWHKAVLTRTYYFLNQWEWYELLGGIAPLFLFGLLWYLAKKNKQALLERFAFAVCLYGIFQMIVALMMLEPSAFIRLAPLQPMRFLLLIYAFMALMAGCLIGKFLLRKSVWRWAVFLLATNAGMMVVQQLLYDSSAHLEMPWQSPSNAWLQAFEWIRENTPTDAYFTIDPNYLAARGEDYHCFRVLAERSVLADNHKDAAVSTQVPELAPIWDQQHMAAMGFSHFQLEDFERLKNSFGVNWTLVSYPQPKGLLCEWHNDRLAVCRIP